jgi:hypothetical protein
MRGILLRIVGLALLAMPVSAQTADEIIAKYIKTIGGAEKIEVIKTLRRTGNLPAAALRRSSSRRIGAASLSTKGCRRS